MFINFGTTESLNQIVLYCSGSPVHYKVFSSRMDGCQEEFTPPSCGSGTTGNITRYPPRGRIILGWETLGIVRFFWIIPLSLQLTVSKIGASIPDHLCTSQIVCDSGVTILKVIRGICFEVI